MKNVCTRRHPQVGAYWGHRPIEIRGEAGTPGRRCAWCQWTVFDTVVY